MENMDYVFNSIFSILNTTFKQMERVWRYVWIWLRHWRNLAIALHQDRMIIDRLEGGQGMYIYVCVSMCVPEWGVVDVFTMGNEPISRLPRGGGMWGCLLGEWGLRPIFPLPKCGSLPILGWFPLRFRRNNNPPAPPKTLIKSLTR